MNEKRPNSNLTSLSVASTPPSAAVMSYPTNVSHFRKSSVQEPSRIMMLKTNRLGPDDGFDFSHSTSTMSLVCCSRCCLNQNNNKISTNLESSNATSEDFSLAESLPDISYFKTHLIDTIIQSAPARTGEILLKNFDRNLNGMFLITIFLIAF